MEFAPGGDLFKYVTERNPHGKLREDQARWVFQQLVIGLDYCHRRVRCDTLCGYNAVHVLL